MSLPHGPDAQVYSRAQIEAGAAPMSAETADVLRAHFERLIDNLEDDGLPPPARLAFCFSTRDEARDEWYFLLRDLAVDGAIAVCAPASPAAYARVVVETMAHLGDGEDGEIAFAAALRRWANVARFEDAVTLFAVAVPQEGDAPPERRHVHYHATPPNRPDTVGSRLACYRLPRPDGYTSRALDRRRSDG